MIAAAFAAGALAALVTGVWIAAWGYYRPERLDLSDEAPLLAELEAIYQGRKRR